jgi:hypothetical protein
MAQRVNRNDFFLDRQENGRYLKENQDEQLEQPGGIMEAAEVAIQFPLIPLDLERGEPSEARVMQADGIEQSFLYVRLSE